MTAPPGIASVEMTPPHQPLTLREEIELQANGGPNVEPPTAAMFTAVLNNHHSAIQELLNEAADHAERRGIGNGPAVSGLRTTLVHYFRTRCSLEGQEFSDAALLTPEDWEQPFDMLCDDLEAKTSMAFESVHSDLTFFTAMTPVKERVVSVGALAQLAKERWPNGINALEIGPSIMVGDLQLLHSDEFPMTFQRVQVATREDASGQDITESANRLVGHRSAFRHIVAVDIYPLYSEARQEYDPLALDYALSGLRVSERNSAYLDIVKSLIAKKHRGAPSYTPDNGVTFKEANLLEISDFAEFKDQFPVPFDLIFMNYLTQELTPEGQIKMHERALSLLSENGLLIYNHQAYIPAEHRAQPTSIFNVKHLETYATIPYSSSTHFVDMQHPIRGVQQAFVSRDNRCRDIRVERAAQLMINGALEPLSELMGRY